MSFEWPLALVALALVPLALGAYFLLHRRRQAAAAQFTAPALLPNLVDRSPGWRRHLPPALLLVAFAALAMGVARPHATVSVRDENATVVLALDISRSMSATDVRPTRLDAARRALRTFIRDVPERYRIGVVAFGSKATVVLPATRDRALVRAALRNLGRGEGTAVGDAVDRSLLVARQAVGRERTPRGKRPPAAILVMSDGANTAGRVTPQRASALARRQGVPVHTVVLGTTEGIVERTLPGGFTERIRVPPDARTLRALASSTGGRFFEAADPKALRRIYDELGSRLGRRDEEREVTHAFAAAGGLLAVAAALLSGLWFQRVPT
jgi:Ca-activated chloride channel family protein